MSKNKKKGKKEKSRKQTSSFLMPGLVVPDNYKPKRSIRSDFFTDSERKMF